MPARAHAAAAFSASETQIGVLAFEMAQNVLQPFLDPPEIAGARDRGEASSRSSR